jgi:hypothetical protein
MRIAILKSGCVPVAIRLLYKAVFLPIPDRLKHLYKRFEPIGGANLFVQIAHTGNAWAGSLVFADALLVLISLL